MEIYLLKYNLLLLQINPLCKVNPTTTPGIHVLRVEVGALRCCWTPYLGLLTNNLVSDRRIT